MMILPMAVLALATLTDDPQQAKSFSKEITVTVKLNYLLYLPDGYDQGDKTYPLVVFLHGAGESGEDLNKVKTHGPPKLVAAGKKFPFILVSPQSSGRGWQPDTLDALLTDVMKQYRVDPDRVYLTGLSMGGFGTWAWSAAHPERFAAIAPICGGGNPREVDKIRNLPIWVFHGARDTVVPLKSSETMVDALKAAGNPVRFTVYPEAAHDSWTETYDNPEFFEWLLAQKRSKK